ncbi:hypothetical protein B9Z55_019389 [Caenorhabditis nigoni]|uniref:Uncharacterized protein n=1 Tax=Caenorhabditis nigoni TaxID=1611254 RepID=A0A2G5TI61_9PELO|nr:hypothetical protein B9Z55_019389 [Caenorhabditis nigoni]
MMMLMKESVPGLSIPAALKTRREEHHWDDSRSRMLADSPEEHRLYQTEVPRNCQTIRGGYKNVHDDDSTMLATSRHLISADWPRANNQVKTITFLCLL